MLSTAGGILVTISSLVESIPEFYPQALWQRCVVHFYRNVFSFVPHGKVKEVATMLKAIHAQENREEASRKGPHCPEAY